MSVKTTLSQNLTEQQRLERLTRLCDELQTAAGPRGRITGGSSNRSRQTAQELLTNQKVKPQ